MRITHIETGHKLDKQDIGVSRHKGVIKGPQDRQKKMGNWNCA